VDGKGRDEGTRVRLCHGIMDLVIVEMACIAAANLMVCRHCSKARECSVETPRVRYERPRCGAG
jgi:hypothetical protein